MINSAQKQDFILPIMVSNQSQRQSYVFDLIFKEILGIEYVLVDKFYEGAVLAYGLDSGFWSHSYLYNENLEQPVFEIGEYQERIFPFFADTDKYFLPFDIFSICFYFVSRHEEFGQKSLDKHGRFMPKDSWLFQHGWQFEPIVNYLVEWLKIWIQKTFKISLNYKNQYQVAPSFDIDNAYAFYGREKSLLPSIMLSLLKGNIKELVLKIKCVNNKKIDPFNTHHKLIEQIQEQHKNAKVFFLMKSGGLNANNRVDLVKDIALLYKSKGFKIGLHPAYGSDETTISTEKKILEAFVKQEVQISRFHFIRFNPHIDYPMLSKIGVREDYSMGYAAEVGFRAGICNPYQWFDLKENRVIDLKVVPFCFMDATYIFNLQYTSNQAVDSVKSLVKTVKNYNGELSFIFHNESISGYGRYENWGGFLSKILKIV